MHKKKKKKDFKCRDPPRRIFGAFPKYQRFSPSGEEIELKKLNKKKY